MTFEERIFVTLLFVAQLLKSKTMKEKHTFMFIKRAEKCGLTGVFCCSFINYLKGVKMTFHGKYVHEYNCIDIKK